MTSIGDKSFAKKSENRLKEITVQKLKINILLPDLILDLMKFKLLF
jgi:ABC-type polysaccharide/polyol phosphate transport system ATPase subunit